MAHLLYTCCPLIPISLEESSVTLVASQCRGLNITPAGPSARIVKVLGTDLHRHLPFTLAARYMWVMVQPWPILNTVEGCKQIPGGRAVKDLILRLLGLQVRIST